jgi:phage-related holin
MQARIDTTQTFVVVAAGFVANEIFIWLHISPIQFLCLGVLIVADFCFGILAVLRLDKSKFDSKIMSYGALSKLLLFFVPALASVAEHAMDTQGLYITSTCIWIISMSQLASIVRHFGVIKSGKYIAEIDAISYVLRWLKKQLEKAL